MKATRDEAERNKRTLQQLLRLPHNKECADCSAKGPTWCAINWGVFLCINCAGIHRKLGVHISKVKSCTLDDWITQDVELVKRVQNGLQKSLYEYGLSPGYGKPNENSGMGEIERFIRQKYEQKRWMRKGADKGAAGITPQMRIDATVSNPSVGSPNSPSTPLSDSSFVEGSSHDNSPPSPANGGGGFDPRGRRYSGDNAAGTSNNYRQRQRLANSANRRPFVSSSTSRIQSSGVGAAAGNRLTPRGSSSIRSDSRPNGSVSPGPQKPTMLSPDDLLQFDSTPHESANLNNGSSNGNNITLEALLGGHTGGPGENSEHNIASAASANTAPGAHPSFGDTKGSKDDILRLFDQPQQHQMPHGYGQYGMYYGMQTMMGMPQHAAPYGYGGQFPSHLPNSGVPPAMYNNNNNMGFYAHQQQHQQQQQQPARKKW